MKIPQGTEMRENKTEINEKFTLQVALIAFEKFTHHNTAF